MRNLRHSVLSRRSARASLLGVLALLGSACAFLATGCSDPAGVVERPPARVVFGPATVAFNAPDFVPDGALPFPHSLSVDGEGRFRWTFERLETRGLASCQACSGNPPRVSMNGTFAAFPSEAVWASVLGGEMVLTLRSHLGFDLQDRDGSAIAKVYGSWWGGEGAAEPVVDGVWAEHDVDLPEGAGLALHAPILWRGMLDVLHTSYYWVARWRLDDVVQPDAGGFLETSIRGALDLDALTLRLTPSATVSRSAPLSGENVSWASVEGTTGTLRLSIRNPSGGHFALSVRADPTMDPVLVDVPAGEATAELRLEHALLLRAAPGGFVLELDLRPAGEAVYAHFAPDRSIEVEATLRVDVPPSS